MALSKNLHLYQEELLSQVNDMTGIADLIRPSPAWDGMTSTISGASADYIIPDEIHFTRIPKATFEDPEHPLATVKVWSEEMPLSHNQPLPVIVYIIEAADRRSAPTRNWNVAYATAEAMHEKMVAALVADRKKHQPNYGRF